MGGPGYEVASALCLKNIIVFVVDSMGVARIFFLGGGEHFFKKIFKNISKIFKKIFKNFQKNFLKKIAKIALVYHIFPNIQQTMR